MALFGPPDIPQMEAKRDIQGLIKALSYKDAAIRRAAAEALTPMKNPTAAESMVALLGDENPGVRRAAVAALSARGGARVVDPLVSALQDADSDVRAAASTAVYRRLMTDADGETRRATAAALGRIRDTNAVEPLVKGVMDPDETVRITVIKALQSIGDVGAVAPLVVVLAHEQVRHKSTGRSSLAVERAAATALDALCDESAVESLETALKHDDADVREIAVRRLAQIASPRVIDPLVASLQDEDPIIRRAAARGLAEIQWQAPADETGVRYYAALREWRRCAECGEAALPTLLSSFDHVDPLEQSDIIAALIQLKWKPTEADSMAGYFWAAQHRWDKCTELGEPAVEALDGILRSAPKWRDRVGAAATLAGMDQPRSAPFTNLDLVQRSLAILDGKGSDKDKRDLLETLMADEQQVEPGAGTIEWCKCGYPAYRVRADSLREPLADVLGFEKGSNNATTYYCPGCDTRRTTVTG
jgi:HEAT repeat protein